MRYLEQRAGIYYYRRVKSCAGKRTTHRVSLRTRDYLRAQKLALDLYFADIDNNPIVENVARQSATLRTTQNTTIVDVHEPYFESEPVQATEPLPCPTESKIEAIEGGFTGENVTTLSTVVDLYVQEAKANWADREHKTQKALFDSFVALVGNIDIQTLTKQHAVNFKASLSKNSGITINKKLYKLQALFDYIHNHYEIPNIFSGLLVKRAAPQNKRSAYTHDEIKTLLAFADGLKEKHQFRKYLVWLSVTTGARANELCQLRKSDIIDVNGHVCLSINDNHSDKVLKTPSAARIVPLHSHLLLKSGFLEYIARFADDERLFPELTYADGGYSKYYAAWFGRCNPIKHRNLHELRHHMATRLKENNTSLQVAAAVLGHTTGNNMTFETYGSGASIPVELLKEAIEGIRYA